MWSHGGDPEITKPDFKAGKCGLAEIPSNFPNNTEMAYVDFTDNVFATFAIPEDLTIPLIFSLDLTSNFLESFPDMTSVGHLRKLNLNHNKVTSIDPALLVNLVDLEELQVEYNMLTSVPDVNIPSDALVQLSLCGNQLTSFPELMHLGKNLTTLELCSNEIADFDLENEGLYPMLQVLDLNKNALIHFPDVSVVGDTLIELGIGRNELKDMPRVVIASLVKLEKLDLTGNPYTSPPDVGVLLDTLKILDLAFLKMGDDQALVDYVFDVVAGRGMQVNLKGLKVSSIPPTLCDSGKDFDYLELQRIPLVCDCRLRWLKVATLAGQRTDLEAQAVCEGGPARLVNTTWEDITISDLVCDEASSVSYMVSEIDFTCLEMPADEGESWDTSALACAHACTQRTGCFLFRHRRQQCSLIVQGSGKITDVSNLYKIV